MPCQRHGTKAGRLRLPGRPPAEVRPQDFDDIARWLSARRQITHSGGLRHAFARLDVNDVLRLEQECSIWRSGCYHRLW